jgi:hypothetical protein
VLAGRVGYEAFIKAVVFVPMAIAATALAVIFLFVYAPDPDIGLLNAVLGVANAGPVSRLGQKSTVNYALILVGFAHGDPVRGPEGDPDRDHGGGPDRRGQAVEDLPVDRDPAVGPGDRLAWHLLAAGAFILMLVPLIVFFSLRRFFVQGLLAGGVK